MYSKEKKNIKVIFLENELHLKSIESLPTISNLKKSTLNMPPTASYHVTVDVWNTFGKEPITYQVYCT